ncbi:MAG: PD-(D/E)XK nuclease family protein [Acidimicrobiales bacterium]
MLQTIDLGSGADLDDAVAAQCEAEAVPDRALVRRRVADALGAACVREAAGAAHWREVYACTPIEGGRLLEGYVDLLYRGPDGLVVVDHKTAATSDPAELDRRVEGYRFQGASYALAVAAATGEQVVRVVFLVLTPDGAVERDLPDLAAAVAEVRQLVVRGNEVVTA